MPSYQSGELARRARGQDLGRRGQAWEAPPQHNQGRRSVSATGVDAPPAPLLLDLKHHLLVVVVLLLLQARKHQEGDRLGDVQLPCVLVQCPMQQSPLVTAPGAPVAIDMADVQQLLEEMALWSVHFQISWVSSQLMLFGFFSLHVN